MERVSVIIPARREKYLNDTLNDVLKKSKTDVEVIVTLDGNDEKRNPWVRYIYNEKPKGMRTAINQAVEIATGKYIMKLDAHCMLDYGFDEKLIKYHQDKWVQIPRRKRLDAKLWEVDYSKDDIDYMYLNSDFMGVANRGKNQNTRLKKVMLDDTETFQGSCYFMERQYFLDLGLLDDVNFNGSGHEAQEITFKVISDGGRIVRNKYTWYAHARLGRYFSTDKTKSREYIRVLAKEKWLQEN